MARRLTIDEIISTYLKDSINNFDITTPYKNSKTKIGFRCKKCGYEFGYTLESIRLVGLKCPVCDGNRALTTEGYKIRVKQAVGNEYSVLGEYEGNHTKILMRHNKCGFEYKIEPNSFMQGERCPYCQKSIPFTNEIIDMRLKDQTEGKIKRIGNFVSVNKLLLLQCNNCGNKFKSKPVNFINRTNFVCPFCDKSSLVIPGYTTIDVTHPELCNYIIDKDFAHTHNYWTTIKTKIKCPTCGKILYKKPSSVYDRDNRFHCDRCSDNISFPEKFFMAILDNNNIISIYQASSKTFNWCGNYRYDFYLPDYDCIVETHGKQHYEETPDFHVTLEEQHKVDAIKRNLALSNGIKQYIELDCRKSTVEYITHNIFENNFLANIINSNTDFKACCKIAAISNIKTAYDYYQSGMSQQEISKKLKVSKCTVYDYIKKGKKLYD